MRMGFAIYRARAEQPPVNCNVCLRQGSSEALVQIQEAGRRQSVQPVMPVYRNAPTTWAAAAKRALGPQYPTAPDKEEGAGSLSEEETKVVPDEAMVDVEARALKRAAEGGEDAKPKKQREQETGRIDKMEQQLLELKAMVSALVTAS